MKSSPIKAVVFDLGGVLIDFDFQRANTAAAKVSGLEVGEVQITPKGRYRIQLRRYS